MNLKRIVIIFLSLFFTIGQVNADEQTFSFPADDNEVLLYYIQPD